MKHLKLAGLILAGLVVALLLGGTTYDYGLDCTKCLLDRHVIVQKCFGIPFYRTSKERSPGADYQGIFGKQCQHIFRSGGFGRSSCSLFGGSIGCGTTADGALLQDRLRAVWRTYDLARRIGDKQLARDSFALIDRFMPPDTRMSQGAKIPAELSYLCLYLDKVRTIDDWRRVLECARDGFRELPQLPDA